MNGWYRRMWEAEAEMNVGLAVLSASLAPAEWGYRLAIRARDAAYGAGWLRSRAAPIPTLAIGNLTVGGTGKTPVAAWFARALGARGLKAALVMRGYGGDEVRVHRVINPSVPVYATPVRLAGVRRARDEGADVVVLDDAFQHRALRADAYVVLLAAEEWSAVRRLLPRGPWREPLEAIRRASLAAITRKTAGGERAAEIRSELARLYPGVPTARAEIRLAGLARYDVAGESLGPPRTGRLRCAVAVAGVARPEAVWAQLERVGVEVGERRAYRDHHRYSRRDLEELARLAESGPVVATLKDAVKLGPALGEVAEIFVPVQEVVWECGREAIHDLLDRLAPRRGTHP